MARALPFLCALVACLALPAVAPAASYDVWLCRGPAGEVAGTSPLVRYGAADGTDGCATGGSFDVTLPALTAHADGDADGASVVVPGGVTLTGAEVWRSAATAAVLSAGHYAAQLVQDPYTSGEVRTDCDDPAGCTAGTTSDPLDASNREATTKSPLRALAIEASCRGGACGASLTAPTTFSLYRAHLTLDDPADPAIASASGELAGGTADRSGSFVVDARDAGSGVCSARLTVDGTLAATRSLCPAVLSTLQPGAAHAELTLSADTSGLAAGAHTATVEVADASGRTATATRSFTVAHAAEPAPAQTVTVTTPAPPTQTVTTTVTTPVPAAAPVGASSTALGLKLTETLPARVLPGRTVTLDATAPAWATLRLEKRSLVAPNATWTAVRTLAVGASGELKTTIKANGALQYRVRDDDAISPTVRIVSALRLSLTTSATRLRNGRSLTLRGVLRGAGGDAATQDLQIQALVRGRYTVVGSARPSSTGAFTWHYRFRNTRSSARYRFRVRLLAEKSSPWVTVRSGPVTVLVRG